MGHFLNQESDELLATTENRTLSQPCDKLPISNRKKSHKNYKCTYNECQATFKKPSRLEWHLRQHTGERPYKCTFKDCTKSYTTSSHLKRHEQGHSNIQTSLICDVCSLALSNRQNLLRHYKRVHADPSRISCSECGALFRKKYKLDEHMAIHRNQTFSCEICSKTFNTILLLKKHERCHITRDYPCQEPNCDKIFNKFKDLCLHKRKDHPKEYKCSECEKIFITKGHLKSHSAAHKNSLIPCPHEKCHKVYYYKSNLDTHIRKAHMNLKFYCDICKLGFGYKVGVRNHIQKIHMTKTKPKNIKKTVRKQRKDAGIIKKSMVGKLSGLELPLNQEKELLKRKPKIDVTDTFFPNVSDSE